MNQEQTTIDSILTTCRSIVGILKDKNIPDETGDKAIGQLLAHLDLLLTQYDAEKDAQ